MVSLDGLHPTLMRPRVEALLADPEAKALGLTIVSAFRSLTLQETLYKQALAKYGSPAAAGKWVAPPGHSNHGPRVDGYGTAVDLGLPGVVAIQGQWPEDKKRQVDAIAARHGLASPMEWEDWHFEPIKNWTQPEDIVTEQDKEDIAERVAKKLAGEPDLIGRWTLRMLADLLFKVARKVGAVT